MMRVDTAPHQIALPLIALFVAIIRIVVAVIVGCVEAKPETYPKSRSETVVMETAEAAAMETSHATPMEASHAASVETSHAAAMEATAASAAKAAPRRGDIRAQQAKRGQRQQGDHRFAQHHSLLCFDRPPRLTHQVRSRCHITNLYCTPDRNASVN